MTPVGIGERAAFLSLDRAPGQPWNESTECLMANWHRSQFAGVQPQCGPNRLSECPARQRWLTFTASWLAALSLVAYLPFFVGCAGRNVYRASRLPLEYQAPIVQDLREIPLSQLVAQQGPSDVIVAGDVLEITISTSLDSKTSPVTCRVDDQGFIFVPDIGPVSVGGRRLSEAEKLIAETAIARDVYRQPIVSVVRKEGRTYRVTVTGAVEKPGVYDIPATQADLLTALVQAGGLKKEAEPTVEIRRAGTITEMNVPPGSPPEDPAVEGRLTSFDEVSPETNSVRIDLISATRSPGSDLRYQLFDGDVVYVPERKVDPIFVDGLVTKPGMYEWPRNQEVRLLDALAMAGGRNNPLADDVWILRHVPGREEPIVIKAKLNAIKRNAAENIRIAPGDVITVEETPGTFIYSLLKGFVHLGGSIPLN